VWSGNAGDLIDWSRLEQAERYRSIGVMLRIPYDCVSGTPREFNPLVRRFVCACCRELQEYLPDKFTLRALDDIEAFAYSRGSYERLVEARNAMTVAIRQLRKRRRISSKTYHVCLAVRGAALNDTDLTFRNGDFQEARLPVRRQAELFQLVASRWIEERTTSAALSAR
jgi:hypothetical protein